MRRTAVRASVVEHAHLSIGGAHHEQRLAGDLVAR